MSEARNGPAGVITPAPARPSAGPPAGGGAGGGGGGWAHLMTASGAVEAEIIRGRLQSADIPVALDARDPSPQAWMFLAGNAGAPVRVLVPAALLDAARIEMLEAGVEAGPPEPAEPSPRRRGRAVAIGAVAVAAAILLVIEVSGSVSCALRLFC